MSGEQGPNRMNSECTADFHESLEHFDDDVERVENLSHVPKPIFQKQVSDIGGAASDGLMTADEADPGRRQQRRASSWNDKRRPHLELNEDENHYDRRRIRFQHLGRSVHAMGAGRLGGNVIAKLKRLEKKERSCKRLHVSKRSSSSSAISDVDISLRSVPGKGPFDEKTPLKTSSKSAILEVPEDDFDEEKLSTVDALFSLILAKHINLLLIFVPFGFLAHALGWSPLWTFWLNFVAMIPLASILGDFTEELAAHTNQVMGGLINATFGNAVEVVVGIQALLANEIRVVQASLIGSIFSNLLLVLGGCFFFGGLKYKEQSFNSTAATANMSLLALSSIALVLPTPFADYYDLHDEHVLAVSRFAAVFLMFMYLQLLVFQLQTHKYLFEDDDDELPEIPFWVAMGGLVFVTALIAILSDYLVESIEGFCQSSGVSRTFVGLIILPIVGNAVEHMTAISVAMKDKMDLAMGVCVGSCTQISLFVVPLVVLVGWAAEKDMNLNFPHFEIILFILSIFTVSICLSNPKGNWLEGSLLMTTYLMIAIGFWYEKVIEY